MKFQKGFFDIENLEKFKLWHKKPVKPNTEEEPILLSSAFFKKSNQEEEMSERFFILKKSSLLYKKDQSDPKIRRTLYLENTRMEYSVPEGYLYPKVLPQFIQVESLNKKTALPAGEKDPNFNENGLFSIRLISNMKFTEMFTSTENLFLTWVKTLRYLVTQTDFHDQFDVLKVLGKGSFARVYLCQNKSTGEQYAVKAFSKEHLEAQSKGKQALQVELSLLRELDHPNVIKFYEIHESVNSLYLVMEVLHGGDIFGILERKPSPEETRVILRQLLQAIHYLASKGIIHRDLKPDNIILKYKDIPITKNLIKIVDFGLGTFENVDEYLFKRCGTPGFVAPEVINANKEDPFLRFTPKSDVFSVGIIFFLMLTGQIPYDGESFSDIVANNKKATINFDIPELDLVEPSALDLLQRMIKVDPEFRATAEECLHHKFFEDDCNYMDSSGDTLNLNQSLLDIKSK